MQTLLVIALLGSACTSDDGSDAVTGQTSAETGTGDGEVTTTVTFRDEPEVDARLSQAFIDGSLEEQIDDFLAAPNSGKAAAITTNMGATGELRWAPWILDMHRLAQSNFSDRAAVEALAGLSGLEPGRNRTEDFQIYGQWAQSMAIDPGDGYRQWKLGLYRIIDEEFAFLMDQIGDDQLLSEVHWGGVTRGGIPELNNPERIAVADADWMEADELVLGVEFGQSAVAYPVRILGHHELANDVIDGTPVSIVYCTLCRTGLAFDRRLNSVGGQYEGDDTVLDFQTSGLLWSSNKVMVDNQTDTLWHHLSGTGIGGPLDGVTLAQFPLVTTTWADWLAEHPDSETLVVPGPIFFPDQPERPPIVYSYEPGGAYQNYYDNPDVWFPILDTPDVFPLKTPIAGLTDGEASLAVEVEALAEVGPRIFTVGGSSWLLVPTPGGVRAYDATDLPLLDGEQPELLEDSPDQVVLADGTELPRVAVSQTFWFAWFGDHQQTDTWPVAS